MSVSAEVIGRALPTVQSDRGTRPAALLRRGDRRAERDLPRLEAAQAAGHPDLPVPPTFLFGLKLDGPEPLGWIADLGIDMRFVLHGTQQFDYRRLVFAGDEVIFRPRITDVYEKRGGALEFVVVDTEVIRGADVVAVLTETIVVRHPDKEAAA